MTLGELGILLRFTPGFTILDWAYVVQHGIVLAVALSRPPPSSQDRSLATGLAVGISYLYPYAQVLYLRWDPGLPVSYETGLALALIAVLLSLSSLLSLGRAFGIRPALRALVTSGPYRIIRHPMYLAYFVSDIAYNLQSWNAGTLLLVAAGWTSLIYRIHAEERILSRDLRWQIYARHVRHRLIPGFW